jgi:hypothetical protein
VSEKDDIANAVRDCFAYHRKSIDAHYTLATADGNLDRAVLFVAGTEEDWADWEEPGDSRHPPTPALGSGERGLRFDIKVGPRDRIADVLAESGAGCHELKEPAPTGHFYVVLMSGTPPAEVFTYPIPR